MNISHNWLKDYILHDLTPKEVADTLTMLGLEEEESWTVGNTFPGLIVGYVLTREQHPNADKLSVCHVDLDGSGKGVKIVCGAPNVAAGQKVVVATIGTKLMLPTDKHNPDAPKAELTIKKGKIRGEESNGMICSEMELGLSDDHSGIMVLTQTAVTGQTFATYLDQQGTSESDTVTDVNITPNRPDAISYLGIARDLSAVTGIPVQLPAVDLPEHGGEAAHKFTVEIECPDVCHRYVGMLIEGVKVGPSPKWVQQRLEAIGLRPRNNIVDITNYVMYECGQPLHAFDFDQIAGHKIVVRQSEGELPFTTLDSKPRILPKGTIMICDGVREVAIGGIMGGENSEVTDATVNVLLESAWFDPTAIRKAAKNIREAGKEEGRLSTDASYRFERGVDPNGQVWAAARAAALIAELSGGQVVPGMVDANPIPDIPLVLTLRPTRARAVIGADIPDEEMSRLLTAIGFKVSVLPEGFACSVPTFRPDVGREIDIIEEIARLYGYDNIPLPTHSATPNQPPAANPTDDLRRSLLQFGMGMGFREMYTNSMVKAEWAQFFAEETGIVETLNPISSEMGALRPNLLLSALPVVVHNLNHGRKSLRLMEVSAVYRRSESPRVPVKGYDEYEEALFIMTGTVNAAGWNVREEKVTIFDVKGVAESLIRRYGLVQQVQFVPENEPSALTSYQIKIQSGHQVLGVVARLADETAKHFDVKQEVFFASLNWTALSKLIGIKNRRAYQEISRYPIVERDLAVTVSKNEAAGALLETIRRTGGKLLQEVRVFDLYEGDKIAPDTKSIAFSLRLGAPDRTLVDKEVETLVARIVKQLADRHQAVLRT